MLSAIIVLPAKAQEGEEKKFILSGKIIDAKNKQAIPYAHIVVPNKKLGCVADGSGSFIIWAYEKDTLAISSMGFDRKEICLADSSITDEFHIIVELTPSIFTLESVDILPYKTFAQMKTAIVNYKVPEEHYMYEEVLDEVRETALYEARQSQAGAPLSFSPITAIYMAFSKEGKHMRKYVELLERDKYKEIIYKKYNPELVRRFTGIEDQKTLKKFMEYCSFPDEFIERSSEYEILYALSECYKNFSVSE